MNVPWNRSRRRPREDDQLARLLHVTDAALAHLELNELLGELLRRIRAILAVDTCAVLLVDGNGHELVARAAVGLEEEVERGVRIPVGRGFAGRVVAERKPIVIEDLARAEVVNPLLRQKGIKSLLGVPLIVEGNAIGVLHVGSLTTRRFHSAEINLLQRVGDRVALAIEHARLYDAERRMRARLERLQSVTDTALAHLDLEELLAELLTRIREILAVDTCAILLLDDERRELVARAAVGLEEEVERGVRVPVGMGFTGRVVAESRPIVLEDVASADVVSPILHEKGLKTLLGVPLVGSAGAIGVLHVGSYDARDFTPDDVELLELVAERAALAIEKARVHDEMLRLDQLKLNFVAVASHELRAPAASVYGAAATLRGRKDLSDEVREQLQETLWEQASRLRRLIEQLLDLSRLEARAIEIKPAPVVLRSLVTDVVSTVGRREEIEIDVDPNLAATVDRGALERVLANLFSNAKQYGEPPIVVSATQRDQHLRIAVEDAGEGISPELLPRLFDRFERGGSGTGTGLGLAIAKAYAQAHGGDLVYEEGASGGARFEIVLPRR